MFGSRMQPAALEVRNDWLAAAMAAAAELSTNAQESLLEDARVARENVSVLQRYMHICSLLTRYEIKLGKPDCPSLVSVRFPVQLLPSTRLKFIEGLKDSICGFVHEVHHSATTTAVEFLEPYQDDVNNQNEYVNAMAADIWTEITKVFDRETSESSARARLQFLLHDFAARAVIKEQARVRRTREHCVRVRDVCADFVRRQPRAAKKRATAEACQIATQKWLIGAARTGAAASIITLARRKRHARLFEHLDIGVVVAAVARPGKLDNLDVEAIYSCMCRAHASLAAAMNWEVRRADWLSETSHEHPCWCGLTVALDSCEHASDERLLQAPSHMGCFAKRVRVVADDGLQTIAFTCGLTVVRVARLIAKLLKDGHLTLNRLSCNFARRTAVCEFAKYEQAARRVECECLVPFGQTVGIPYCRGALQIVIRNVLQEET